MSHSFYYLLGTGSSHLGVETQLNDPDQISLVFYIWEVFSIPSWRRGAPHTVDDTKPRLVALSLEES